MPRPRPRRAPPAGTRGAQRARRGAAPRGTRRLPRRRRAARPPGASPAALSREVLTLWRLWAAFQQRGVSFKRVRAKKFTDCVFLFDEFSNVSLSFHIWLPTEEAAGEAARGARKARDPRHRHRPGQGAGCCARHALLGTPPVPPRPSKSVVKWLKFSSR